MRSKAIRYTLSRWESLNHVLRDGRVCNVINRIDHPVSQVADLLPWNITGLKARLDQRKEA